MTDRELLELAARAAGYEFKAYYVPMQNRSCNLSTTWGEAWAEVIKPESPFGACRWNPIDDDCDALRLAVKLRLNIHHNQSGKYVSAHNAVVECTELIGDGDEYAATRRAIVRAAAAIGEGMV